MNSGRKYLLAAAAAAAVFLLVLFRIGGDDRQQERDMLMLNDIVQTVRAHIRQPETLQTLQFDTELIVFSGDGTRIYATAAIPETVRSVSDAGRAGYFCMAVTEEGCFLGTAAVPDPVLSEYGRKQKRILLTALLSVSFIMLLLIAAGVVIRVRIILPFRRMQQFAERIAQGNLDDPLLAEKHDLFGCFTESFDLMREELRAARSREDELKLREKELTAALSHDIKTPVTGIKLICELLMCKTDDAYVREKVGGIQQKAEQIHVLADEMLTASLDELGEMRVHCCDEPAAVLQTLLAEHDTQKLVRAEPVPDCLISTDTGRLSQVIANIISNSYKYAGTEIRVRYAFQDHYLAMELADSGGGVPEEEIDLLTVKYYRGKTNAAGRDGSGLGLYISGELMKRMNGHLGCANTADGLAVTLLIPLS